VVPPKKGCPPPHHVTTRLAVFARSDGLNEKRHVEVFGIVDDVEIAGASIGLDILLFNLEVVRR
jgi:hypothetical protein